MSLVSDLTADLKVDEGVKLFVYDDATGKRLMPGDTLEGHATIGTGRNISGLGISTQENDVLLANDIGRVIGEATRTWPWYIGLPQAAQRGLLNMLFNLGLSRLLLFTNMLSALEQRRFDDAADEALKSKWADQVGARAVRIATLFRSCA